MPRGDRARLLTTAIRARWKLEELADELPYATPVDREALKAGVDFEGWLLESCRYALPAVRTGRKGRS